MATTDIGRVTPIWRGFYSAATTYELNDIVIDTAGSVWWHKSEEITTGVAPGSGEIWDAVLDMSEFSGLIQAAITTAQTALVAAQEAVAEVTADTERAETAARNAETFAQNAAESASDVGAQAQAAAASAEAAAGSATGAAGSAQAAAGSKSDAEAYAVGTRGGEDVGSTDPTYHNNAKYYAEQAASEAEAAAQSAEDAQDVLDSIPEDYSQLSADVGELKTQINSVANLKVNLFDKTSATLNQKMQSNGTPVDETGTLFTDYFPISRGKTYTTLYYQTIGSYNLMVLYSNTKSRAGTVNGVRNGDYVSYTVPDNSDIYAYGIINNAVANLDTLMIVEGDVYPTQYAPYNTIVLKDEMPLSQTQETQVDNKISPVIASVGTLANEVEIAQKEINSIAKNVNLFDKTKATSDWRMLSNGTTIYEIGTLYTDYIPINPGDTIITKYYSTIGASYMVVYNGEKEKIGSFNGVRNGDYVTYTASNVQSIAYCIINNAVANLDTLMIVKGIIYPSEYIPYGDMQLRDEIVLTAAQNEQVDNKVNPLATESPNLFNKNSNDLLNGYYSSGFIANNVYRMTHVIALEAGKSYKYKHSPSLGGNYQIPYTNKDGDFTSGYLVGTISNGIVTLTPNENCYVRVNIGRAIQKESFMFTESDKYPSEYKAWGQNTGANLYPSERFKHPNLNGKMIVFDGDSICAGDHDTPGVKGYAQRIGTDAGMEWQNVAVGGATIAKVSNVSHNLCTYIDTIHTSNLYNALDYLILEGGTNDAAHLGDLGADGLGTLTDQNNNSGPYDEETFYGALETLFYKATQYFPNKKIGFIIAMKMAGWSDSANKMVIPAHRAEYFDAVRLACEKWGIPYLDLWKTCIMNPCTEAYYYHSMTEEQNLAAGKMYADGQHPNAIGYDFLSPIIENWIAIL